MFQNWALNTKCVIQISRGLRCMEDRATKSGRLCESYSLDRIHVTTSIYYFVACYVSATVNNYWLRICSRFIWISTVTTAVVHFTNVQYIKQSLSSGITSLLTVLDLFCPASSSLSLISLSDSSLSVSSVSHPLKRILCQLEREHLLQGFSFSVHENTSVDSQRLTIGCLRMRCRGNVFVTQTMIQETWLPSRCPAMDGRSDSDIPAFSGTPQYFIQVP
jgi:hypothetical protein